MLSTVLSRLACHSVVRRKSNRIIVDEKETTQTIIVVTVTATGTFLARRLLHNVVAVVG